MENEILLALLFLPLIIYVVHVAGYIVGLNRLSRRASVKDIKETGVTVIVPLRNEEENVRRIISDLAGQSVESNRFGVILVDDHSEDDTYDIAKSLVESFPNFRIVHSEGSGKKSAVATGEALVADGIIAVTDADCRLSPDWVKQILVEYEQNTGMLILPVILESDDSLLGKLVSLESLSLLGTSLGSAGRGQPVLCSGANLAYSTAFRKTLPELRNRELLSGDDMFLLEAARKENKKMVGASVSKKSIVTSPAPVSLMTFIDQRVRWAGKSIGFEDRTILWHGFIVWISNLILLIVLLIGIFYQPLLKWAIAGFITKGIIDFLFLFLVASRVGRRRYLVYFPVAEILYLPYSALFPLIALCYKPTWRGRQVR